MKKMQAFAAGLVVLALGGFAQAAEFDVGRATVVFSTDGWRETSLPDAGLKYKGDREGALAAERKLLIKESPQHGIEAVVLMRSNRGITNGYMTYERRCESTDTLFAEGATGGALRVADCLRVFPLYSTASLLADMDADVQSAMKGLEGKLPKGMYAVTSEYWNTTGSALLAYVLLAPGVTSKAASDALGVVLPKGIEPSHVAWGRELNRAVRGSVNSIFGTMAFPDVELNAPAAAPEKPLMAGQPQ